MKNKKNPKKLRHNMITLYKYLCREKCQTLKDCLILEEDIIRKSS